jgi:hypothetical protein
MNDLVSIINFNVIGSDTRGSTLEFQLPREQSNFIFLTRKANSISGNTYHEGRNSGTNPKLFLLLSGKIKISYRKIDSEHVFDNILDKPSIIKVTPLVTHKIEVIEDATIIECNSITDIQSDRIKELV